MGPRARGKPGARGRKDPEQRELEEEAMAEWLARGHRIQDFTMDKMLALWVEEDDAGGSGADEGEEDGETALSAKQELMRGLNVLAPVVEQAKDLAERVRTVVQTEAAHALKVAWEYAEIPPLKRRRLLREHVAHVLAMDQESRKYEVIKRRVIEDFEHARTADQELQFGLRKRNQRRAPLLGRTREMKDEADREQQARILADIERTRRERMDRELAEKQRLRAEKEAFTDHQRAHRRRMNMKFWKKQYAEAKDFAEQHSLARTEQRRRDEDDQLARMRAEIEEMDGQEAEDYARAFDRSVTTSSLGIFDTSYAPGEWNSSIDGGPRPGMDEHQVGIFSARGFQEEHEQLRIDLMDAQSRTQLLEEKLEQIAIVRNQLLQDKQTMMERKDRLQSEIRHLNQEHEDLSQQLAGPPRRDPTDQDKMQFHLLVSRRAALLKQLHEMTARESYISARMQIATRSELSLQPQLDSSLAVLRDLEAQLSSVDQRHNELPIVVGRSIHKNFHPEMTEANSQSQIAPPFTDHMSLYRSVTMQSKLTIMKEAAVPVREHFKKVKHATIENWKTNELKTLEAQELDVTKTRLANIRDRMIELQKDGVREDLMQAIRRFHNGTQRLRKCRFPVSGHFEWWTARDSSRSSGLSYDDKHSTIFLDSTSPSGCIRGCIRLPKNCLYRMSLRVWVFQQSESREGVTWVPVVDNGCEYVAPEVFSLLVGYDYDSLQDRTFTDLSGRPRLFGDLKFEFLGARLFFSVSFNPRMGGKRELSPLRLVLENSAKYEERLEDFREEESKMRMIQKEKHFLSELVKTLRLQTKKSSSQRCADLMQELIQVERSKEHTWDSALLHGHQQRFKRIEYARMLRLEIKGELARQIDYDILKRKGRSRVKVDEYVANDGHDNSEDEEQQNRRNLSRMDFLSRKFALIEPQLNQAKKCLGDYCSFKAPEEPSNEETGSYRKEALIYSIRLEWREGRTKLHVMQKLCDSSTAQVSGQDLRRIGPASKWFALQHINAVFLESACLRVLRSSREEDKKRRSVQLHTEAAVQKLKEETRITVELGKQANVRDQWEDEYLRSQKEHDLAKRAKLLHAEAIRTATYNEQVSSQIDFLAHRKMNSANPTTDNPESLKGFVDEAKDEYARRFVEGRLALAKKTWERKERRILMKREKERKERDFRVSHENQLINEIANSSQHTIEQMKKEEQKLSRQQLTIPNFKLAVGGIFKCEHVELKAWGGAYGAGMRCKRCGKEMSASFDDPDHHRGADHQLDHDIAQQRAEVTGGPPLKLRSPNHFKHLEEERIRLEKEAYFVGVSEAYLYDRVDPQVIEEFNYRHNLNRHQPYVRGDDPLYPRTVGESHRASFQDDILFHGRLRNYHVRIHQISEVHRHTTTMLAVQRDFLESVQQENDFVLSKLPLVERDHARAVRLLKEDLSALKDLQAAQKALDATRKDRERAYYALEGVEEEAEFAEFHAPALIKCSSEMTLIVQRMRAKLTSTQQELLSAQSRLETATKNRAETENRLTQLQCRLPGTPMWTRYGLCKVLQYRNEDDFVVLSPSGWVGSLYIHVNELVAIEARNREAEIILMKSEESRTRQFLSDEDSRTRRERERMILEDCTMKCVVGWHTKKVEEEFLIHDHLCHLELSCQLNYEKISRKELQSVALDEAKKMQHYTRVSLQRRRQVPGSISRSSRLDVMRVARACEKRLAMQQIEEQLILRDATMRAQFRCEQDMLRTLDSSSSLLEQLVNELVLELSHEVVDQDLYEGGEDVHISNHGIAYHNEPSAILPVHISRCLDELWMNRKRNLELMETTWGKEHSKLVALRSELSRREEIKRRENAERELHDRRRKEMYAEERWCRRFYLEEMVLCIKERKAMASAELEMKDYIRQLELESMKAKYASMIDERNKTNDKAARRLEIKLGKNEKHRLHREWAQIKAEDVLAMQVREEEISRSQAEALERQFDRFLIQQSLEGKIRAELDASRHAERIKEAQRVAAEARAAFDAKLVQEKMIATVEVYHHCARVELDWMHAVERVVYWTNKATPIECNLIPLENELRRVLSEKDNVVADAIAKRQHAERCKQNARDADVMLEQAIKHEEECNKRYRIVHYLNATMDSAVLHGRPQRFRTPYLRDQLHVRYFNLLTESIIRQAIVECNEREASRLEAKLKELEDERAFKIREVGILKRKRRRKYHMRLRRSELGKLMFGGSQRQLIKLKFQQWVEIWSRRMLVRASFEVKHGLLMQQHRIAETQKPTVREGINTKLTILHQQHKQRLQCRLCKQEFTEEQNNRYSCTYHPGAYELACVRSCPTRQMQSAATAPVAGSSTLLASCMAHRTKRWLCCDATEEGRYGSNGCTTRYHLPVRSNPALTQLVETKEQEERALLKDIDTQLQELKARDVAGKAKLATKTIISKIEEDLAQQRSKAAKFFHLDRR